MDARVVDPSLREYRLEELLDGLLGVEADHVVADLLLTRRVRHERARRAGVTRPAGPLCHRMYCARAREGCIEAPFVS